MIASAFAEIECRLTRQRQPPATESKGLKAPVVEDQWRGFLLLHAGAPARGDGLSAERVRMAERKIDRHNQLRNDAVETLNAAPGAPVAAPSSPHL